MTVRDNLTLAILRRVSRAGVLDPQRERGAVRRALERLQIKTSRPSIQEVRTLSGGNQQKVLLGRWLERNSDVLVLIEPTRGVDVGARQDIYAALRKLAADGMAVLIATSDYEEAVQVADRAYVMAKGRIVTELSGAAVTSARLLEASGG